MYSVRDPGSKLIKDDENLDIKKGQLGDISPSTASSGYGSAFQAKLADLEVNLSEGLGKPYKVDIPIEEDSVVINFFWGFYLNLMMSDQSLPSVYLYMKQSQTPWFTHFDAMSPN